jgi:tRNA threonylcarbamoyladenosine modification (KEOPS) complex Cgi121 subunit
MEDPVLEDTKGLEAWLVKTPKGEAQRLMESVVGSAKRAGIEILVLRGDMVLGEDHLRSALYHAKRALKEGSNSSDSLAMETLLYSSGERQLSTAIRKMSINDETSELAIAKLTDMPFRAQESWTPMPILRTDFGKEALSRFGISGEELATTDSSRATDLVLERIAAVDVMKK